MRKWLLTDANQMAFLMEPASPSLKSDFCSNLIQPNTDFHYGCKQNTLRPF